VLSAGIHIAHNGVVVGRALSSRSCRPTHIFEEKNLSAAQKLKRLRAWHYDIVHILACTDWRYQPRNHCFTTRTHWTSETDLKRTTEMQNYWLMVKAESKWFKWSATTPKSGLQWVL
jgi:hypothetical protein